MATGMEESIRRWLKLSFPAMLPLFEEIVAGATANESRFVAMMQLLSIGWRAGLQHQHDHPEDWPELVAHPQVDGK